MITIENTTLDGVLLIKPSTQEDFRGSYTETFNEELYTNELKKRGINIKFIQDDISISSHHVLRGLHGDNKTWKLLSCMYGKVYYVIANCDESSKDFGKWEGFILSDENKYQILAPPMYGSSYFVLSDKTTFHYKQTTYYGETKQFTYKHNDKRFNIIWPIEDPILSERDR